MSRRRPAVAGRFYPGSAREIKSRISELVDDASAGEKAIGVMAPHAGWVFSGRCAGMVYSRVEIPETVLIMCPNHHGLGADAAIMSQGAWEMPTGDVEIDSELARLLMKHTGLVREDARAHSSEHSLEVHLPLLQHFRPEVKLVPLSLFRLDMAECEELGKAIAAAALDFGKAVLVIASSDMTHFESADEARIKDKLALDRMLELDPKGLLDVVRRNGITMCGVVPAAVMLVYALARGAKKAELVDYRNSGDVTGDYRDVVAYASVIVK